MVKSSVFYITFAIGLLLSQQKYATQAYPVYDQPGGGSVLKLATDQISSDVLGLHLGDGGNKKTATHPKAHSKMIATQFSSTKPMVKQSAPVNGSKDQPTPPSSNDMTNTSQDDPNGNDPQDDPQNDPNGNGSQDDPQNDPNGNGLQDDPQNDPNGNDPNGNGQDDPNGNGPQDDPNQDDPNQVDPNQDDPSLDDPSLEDFTQGDSSQNDPNQNDPNQNGFPQKRSIPLAKRGKEGNSKEQDIDGSGDEVNKHDHKGPIPKNLSAEQLDDFLTKRSDPVGEITGALGGLSGKLGGGQSNPNDGIVYNDDVTQTHELFPGNLGFKKVKRGGDSSADDKDDPLDDLNTKRKRDHVRIFTNQNYNVGTGNVGYTSSGEPSGPFIPFDGEEFGDDFMKRDHVGLYNNINYNVDSFNHAGTFGYSYPNYYYGEDFGEYDELTKRDTKEEDKKDGKLAKRDFDFDFGYGRPYWGGYGRRHRWGGYGRRRRYWGGYGRRHRWGDDDDYNDHFNKRDENANANDNTDAAASTSQEGEQKTLAKRDFDFDDFDDHPYWGYGRRHRWGGYGRRPYWGYGHRWGGDDDDYDDYFTKRDENANANDNTDAAASTSQEGEQKTLAKRDFDFDDFDDHPYWGYGRRHRWGGYGRRPYWGYGHRWGGDDDDYDDAFTKRDENANANDNTDAAASTSKDGEQKTLAKRDDHDHDFDFDFDFDYDYDDDHHHRHHHGYYGYPYGDFDGDIDIDFDFDGFHD
ncbi:unnamed protein product [Cunninghamella blakesleeana]